MLGGSRTGLGAKISDIRSSFLTIAPCSLNVHQVLCYGRYNDEWEASPALKERTVQQKRDIMSIHPQHFCQNLNMIILLKNIYLFIYIFIWLCWVLVLVLRIFDFHCDMWDFVLAWEFLVVACRI